jgi:Zn-dependent M28 family amino/carboxypeptidase
LKRFLKISLLIILTIILIIIFQNYPGNSQAKLFERLSDTVNIKRCLELVVNTSKPRWFRNVDVLDTVANRIQGEFLRYTNSVSFQNFTIQGAEYRNIIASFGPDNAERIIVGAHYDVFGEQDGADDNASGVAGILELARLLKDKSLKYRIDLVAYSTEEPPYFDTNNMGSYIHAKSLSDEKVPVFGMVSLEMIGYYSDDKNSQRYPVGFLKMFYGDKGNFITVVQKSFGGKFARVYKRLAFDHNSLPTKSFSAPSFFGGINLSDHMNYWKFGYSAIMITNTSFYRNHNYHKPTDRIATLDINRMALTIDGVYRTLAAFK